MAGKPYVGFNADIAEASALSGFLTSLSAQIKTDRHISPVLKMTHAIMSDEFTAYMSVVAPAQMSRFHHVYEWGQIGDPTAKLWDDVLIGSGSVRTATFKWRASKQSVPVREDFKAKGVKQIHVFVWKAPVMEYGKNIVIAPKRGKFLAYFTGPTNPESKYAMQVTQNPIQVTDPGGPMVKGSFTREYVSWWGGTGAQGVFETKLRKVLEEDLGRMPIEEVTRPFRRARNKKFAFQAIADAEAAERAGAMAAKKFLETRSRKYIEAAKARERLIG